MSEVRFLMGTQNFFFVPRSWQDEKTSFSEVFIVYEYLSETREETIVIGSFLPFHNNLIIFFRKFSAKKYSLSLLSSRFVPLVISY